MAGSIFEFFDILIPETILEQLYGKKENQLASFDFVSDAADITAADLDVYFKMKFVPVIPYDEYGARSDYDLLDSDAAYESPVSGGVFKWHTSNMIWSMSKMNLTGATTCHQFNAAGNRFSGVEIYKTLLTNRGAVTVPKPSPVFSDKNRGARIIGFPLLFKRKTGGDASAKDLTIAMTNYNTIELLSGGSTGPAGIMQDGLSCTRVTRTIAAVAGASARYAQLNPSKSMTDRLTAIKYTLNQGRWHCGSGSKSGTYPMATDLYPAYNMSTFKIGADARISADKVNVPVFIESVFISGTDIKIDMLIPTSENVEINDIDFITPGNSILKAMPLMTYSLAKDGPNPAAGILNGVRTMSESQVLLSSNGLYIEDYPAGTKNNIGQDVTPWSNSPIAMSIGVNNIVLKSMIPGDFAIIYFSYEYMPFGILNMFKYFNSNTDPINYSSELDLIKGGDIGDGFNSSEVLGCAGMSIRAYL